MTPVFAAAVAMMIGVAGTSTIHLSKGVMKLGVVRLRTPEYDRRRARAIYTLGIAMNFTNPLWVIAANRFAPTVYYTSVYGLGLIALLLFSRSVLHEPLFRRQILGVVVLALGTVTIGISELSGQPVSLYGASRPRLLWFAAVWIGGGLIAALVTRRGRLRVQELVFGVAGGGLAALEAVVKGVAQTGPEGGAFLPTGAANWALFIVSFAGAAGAFGMIQWSFLRSCRASIMGAAYTVTYVALPLLLTPFIVGSSIPRAGALVGLLVLAVGIVMVAGEARQPAVAM